MGEQHRQRAERCLSKAADLRALADGCKIETTRDALLRVAASYEKIAETIRLLNDSGVRWSDEPDERAPVPAESGHASATRRT